MIFTKTPPAQGIYSAVACKSHKLAIARTLRTMPERFKEVYYKNVKEVPGVMELCVTLHNPAHAYGTGEYIGRLTETYRSHIIAQQRYKA